MKITLWQQFSSNHSSGFTIIGEFPTHADAERAADEIRAILQKIVDWHAANENSEAMKTWLSYRNWWDNPSPPELALAQQYNVDWPGFADWVWNANIEIMFDRLVLISPNRQCESAGEPFDQLMNALGGKGYLEGDIYGDPIGKILFSLTCTAPDEATAESIYISKLAFRRCIRRNGVKLHFERWYLETIADFPQVIADVETWGCTDIQYSFTQFDPERFIIELYDANDVDMMLDVIWLRKDSGDPEDIGEAFDVLAKFGAERVVDPLIAMLGDDEIRISAVAALGEIGDIRAIQPILELRVSNSNDVSLKQYIDEALHKLDYQGE